MERWLSSPIYCCTSSSTISVSGNPFTRLVYVRPNYGALAEYNVLHCNFVPATAAMSVGISGNAYSGTNLVFSAKRYNGASGGTWQSTSNAVFTAIGVYNFAVDLSGTPDGTNVLMSISCQDIGVTMPATVQQAWKP